MEHVLLIVHKINLIIKVIALHALTKLIALSVSLQHKMLVNYALKIPFKKMGIAFQVHVEMDIIKKLTKKNIKHANNASIPNA